MHLTTKRGGGAGRGEEKKKPQNLDAISFFIKGLNHQGYLFSFFCNTLSASLLPDLPLLTLIKCTE